MILACLLVLAVTAYGVAEDLGLVDPPAQAAPARKPAAGQPGPSRAAVADIPAGYLRLYRQAGARYRIPWPVLAAIGKVESDHGRVRLPGVRSGSNWAGACGPMQLGCVPGSKAGNAWARYGHGRPHDPAAAIPAAARYLVDHGARRNLDRALFAYNHSWAYVAKVKQPRPPLRPRGWAAVSGRIALHLDRGLGWTKPLFVAGCGHCGTELARQHQPGRAERAARRTRCPACGTRTARRLPGTTSPATDLALASGQPGARRPPPLAACPPPARPRRAGRR